MTEQKWQEVTVDPKGAGHTYRLAVPGGWLYRTTTYRYPELHREWEEDVAEVGEDRAKDLWVVRKQPKYISRACEIAIQNVVFVPELVDAFVTTSGDPKTVSPWIPDGIPGGVNWRW